MAIFSLNKFTWFSFVCSCRKNCVEINFGEISRTSSMQFNRFTSHFVIRYTINIANDRYIAALHIESTGKLGNSIIFSLLFSQLPIVHRFFSRTDWKKINFAALLVYMNRLNVHWHMPPRTMWSFVSFPQFASVYSRIEEKKIQSSFYFLFFFFW